MLGSLTLLIALGVALISYAQWRTANQRVVLDLHERRMKVYDALQSAVGDVVRDGASSDDTFRAFVRAENDARFLFGPDVLDYLQKLREDFVFVTTYTVPVIQRDPNREQLFQRHTATLLRINAFFKDGPDKFGPYMRMDQKNTPFWRPW